MSTSQISVLNLNIGSVDIPSAELDVKVSFPDADHQVLDTAAATNGISTTYESTPQTIVPTASIPSGIDDDVKSVEDDDEDDDIRIHLSMDQKTRLVNQPVVRVPQSIAAARPEAVPTPAPAVPAVVVSSSAASSAAAVSATMTRTNSTSGSSSAAGLAHSSCLLPTAG